MKARVALVWGLLSLLVFGPVLMNHAAAQTGGDFYLEVTIVTGEHSRDSNSTTRTLTASPGKLIYKETYAGAHSGQRPPVEKQFKLTKQDQSDLTALLESKSLLATKTISQPPTQKGFSRYFELALVSGLHGKENTIAIDASPSAAALKTDPLYQGSISLIEMLYKIVNRTDPDLTAPTLID